MLLTRLFFSLSLLCTSYLLLAQSNWQVSGGLEIQKGRKTYTNDAQPFTAYNSVVNVERILDLPKSRVVIVLHFAWQQLSANGNNILYPQVNGFNEELKSENILIGPGIQLSLWKRRTYHPILGANIYFGIPMKSMYTLNNSGNGINTDFPTFFSAEGGVSGVSGMYIYTGVERNLGERSSLRLKLGSGQHSQFRHWRARFIDDRLLLKGGLWMSSMEFVYRI